MPRPSHFCAVMRPLLTLALICPPAGAYSALSHEAMIDSVWTSHIRPLLLLRYPQATPEELKTAHAYAYGGSQIQDLGYFPFGSHEYSDYAHYVRSGDFVTALIRDAETIDEFAFALGALAHYTSDRIGHPAVNDATGLVYPGLRHKLGRAITYEDNPGDHLKVEFSLDVAQVARGRYAPDAYHDFVGFEVSEVVLKKAFRDTYAIDLEELIGALDIGVGTYRFTVGRVIPEMTRVAWDSHRSDIQQLSPGITREKFVYALPRAEYRRQWDSRYREPGIFTRFLAFLFRLVPTVGPFKVLSFKRLPPTAEKEFLESFDRAVESYRQSLATLRGGLPSLPNFNLDTGAPARPAEYRLADQAYVHLLDRLGKQHFAQVDRKLRENLLTFFRGADRAKLARKTLDELEELEHTASNTIP
ncbi:MAG TPA: zinc dependent phospholipase C family protein [Bryobacteraceae bacterium]|nr:zinc dependent phospholipase C family protein [Bryobacteraceae bacterium]